MVLSDTTDYNGLLQRCEFYTNLGLGAITGDADLKKMFIMHVNVAQHDLFMLALEAQDAWDVDDHKHAEKKEFTTPLTTNRDYTFAVTNRILDWERVDVSWDGSTYYQAHPIDTTEMTFALGNDTDVDSHFERTAPRYDTRGNQLLLYPKAESADVSNGGKIRMESSREASEFALDGSDDTEEAFIARPFHEQIAIRAAYKWLMVNKPSNESLLSRLEAEIGRGNEAIKDHYSTREADRTFVMTPATGLEDYSAGHEFYQ